MPTKHEKEQQALDLIKANGTTRAAAAASGIPEATLRTRAKRAMVRAGVATVKSSTSAADHKKFEVTKTQDAISIWSVGDSVRTVEDAIEKAEVDLAIWEITKTTLNSYPTSMKVASGSKGDGTYKETPHQEWNWQVKVELRRRVAKHLTDAIEEIHERAKKHSPKYPKVPRKKPTDPHMLEISPFDHHFGKLAWEQETRNNYDLKIAETLYRNAIKDLTGYAANFNIEKILFVLGNDFLHIDNLANTTTGGTPQDTDGRYAKIISTAFMAVVEAIDFLIPIAPVEIKLVTGNHDRTTSYHLARELAAWYRHSKDVTVDTEFRNRKYILYGGTLLGFTHGCDEKHDQLPNLMATEVPDLWASATVHREWHLGHFHSKRQTRFRSVNSHNGTVVTILPSLCGTDKWHYDKAYVGRRAAEAWLWSRERGYAGHFSVNARE